MLKPFKYQQEIIDNAPYRKGYALFMDMGTGKTVVSLEILRKWNPKKILVICLANKTQDWIDDIKTQLGLKAYKPNIQNQNVYVTSFETAWRREWLLKWTDKDTAIIIDESHKIKSLKSKIAKFCDKIRRKTKMKLILTGTPQSKKYIDYYNQLKFIDSKLFNINVYDFKRQYCRMDSVWFNGYPVKQIIGYKHENLMLNDIKKHSAVYTRKLEDDMIPTEQTIRIKNTRKYYKLLRERVDDDGNIYDNVPALMIGLSKITAKNKINRFKELLEECEDQRVVIFYKYNFERDMLKLELNKLDRKFGEYNGHTKDLSNFKSNGVALVQVQSGSTGINDLVYSHIMIFYSLPKSYIEFEQAKKRIDRIGQTQKPMYYYLITEKSFEVKQLKTLKEGRDFDEKTILDVNNS